ncbi:MAG TPA: bifunctional diaminohydroxyphosphoribosylaminopyrimidine deaminase/5-amino-6-(5-phosphoribosylamino)uracil reductase RibD, partial [Candidatus Cloacimonadota bacterium]|nr:bifunctional diaminohydroxyphosphoribosylaminopyrimidine deaminase/5-amino-6-(5-phosphoribosylamino)uracil reductase RibD [Candidatus Cloacimonadota bacterium]
MNPKYMQIAFEEAEKARGFCSPNPFVGAIVVKDDEVIAQAHTQSYGSLHAEAMALELAGGKAKGADLYVTLEPCSHHGKTPPCTEAIIKAGIKRVFFGIRDPNPKVNEDISEEGVGIRAMREAGIEVSWGFMEEEITRQNEYFLCRILKGRPFVTLKMALSLDGKFAAPDGSSKWISSAASRAQVHVLRQHV